MNWSFVVENTFVHSITKWKSSDEVVVLWLVVEPVFLSSVATKLSAQGVQVLVDTGLGDVPLVVDLLTEVTLLDSLDNIWSPVGALSLLMTSLAVHNLSDVVDDGVSSG